MDDGVHSHGSICWIQKREYKAHNSFCGTLLFSSADCNCFSLSPLVFRPTKCNNSGYQVSGWRGFSVFRPCAPAPPTARTRRTAVVSGIHPDLLTKPATSRPAKAPDCARNPCPYPKLESPFGHMVGRAFLRCCLTVRLPFQAVPVGEKGLGFASERSEEDLGKDKTARATGGFSRGGSRLIFSEKAANQGCPPPPAAPYTCPVA